MSFPLFQWVKEIPNRSKEITTFRKTLLNNLQQQRQIPAIHSRDAAREYNDNEKVIFTLQKRNSKSLLSIVAVLRLNVPTEDYNS